MRTVTRYHFQAQISNDQDALDHYIRVLQQLEVWLNNLGVPNLKSGEYQVRVRSGQRGILRATSIDMDRTALHSIELDQPIPAGLFQTHLDLALLDQKIAVGCELRAGGADQPITPIPIDVRCPQILRHILRTSLPWTYGTTSIPTERKVYAGEDQGKTLAALISDHLRLLPLILVSETQGFVLHPGVAEQLAHDLIGLAIVGTVDEASSWALTNTLGQEWSCYGGAIRLYWPGLDLQTNPFRHPLWTTRRLMEGVISTEKACERICQQLRRMIMDVAAFQVHEPEIVRIIRQRERDEHYARERKEYHDAEDYRKLAESYDDEVKHLRRELIERDEQISDLETQLRNLQVSLRWQSETPGETIAVPEQIPPLKTVLDAVNRAKHEFSDKLIFGHDVNDGIKTISPNAGPPDKIYDYLRAIADLTTTRRNGTINQGIIPWLREHGVIASGESSTISQTRDERQKRTWDDGFGSIRYFDLHLKPVEAASPDRCVRIYIDWNEEERAYIIGWIGRHP